MGTVERDPETYAIIGAAMEVHRQLGPGFKALDEIGGVERAQLLNYLKVTGLGRDLILNFGRPSLQFERMIR